jgi:hypothetical protein
MFLCRGAHTSPQYSFIRLSGSRRCGQRQPQVMPFLWEPSLPANCNGISFSGEVSLLGGELALPFRVARVSRLIGNPDITANGCGWQVNFAAPRFPAAAGAFPNGLFMTRQTQEAPLPSEWRFSVPCWSLASRINCGRRYLPPRLLQSPDRSLPFEGRFVGGYSYRVSAHSWAVRVSPAAGTSLASS